MWVPHWLCLVGFSCFCNHDKNKNKRWSISIFVTFLLLMLFNRTKVWWIALCFQGARSCNVETTGEKNHCWFANIRGTESNVYTSSTTNCFFTGGWRIGSTSRTKLRKFGTGLYITSYLFTGWLGLQAELNYDSLAQVCISPIVCSQDGWVYKLN